MSPCGEVGEGEYGMSPRGEVGEEEYGMSPRGEVGEGECGMSPRGEVGEGLFRSGLCMETEFPSNHPLSVVYFRLVISFEPWLHHTNEDL